MKTIALILLTVGITTSCDSEPRQEDKPNHPSETVKQIRDLSDQIAVINVNETYLKKEGRTHAILTEQNINQIDSILSVKLEEYNNQKKIEFELAQNENPKSKLTLDDYIIDLTQYVRQYVVYYNKKGEKEVWINFMCGKPINDEWKQGIVIVSDGGNCFFQAALNLTLDKVTEFSVNGYA